MEKLNLLKKQNALVQEVPATRSKKKKKKKGTLVIIQVSGTYEKLPNM